MQYCCSTRCCNFASRVHHYKWAPCVSSVPSVVAITEPPLSKQGCSAIAIRVNYILGCTLAGYVIISVKGCVLDDHSKGTEQGKIMSPYIVGLYLLKSNKLDITNNSFNCLLVSGQNLQSGICWYVDIKKSDELSLPFVTVVHVLYPRTTVPPTLSMKFIWFYL